MSFPKTRQEAEAQGYEFTGTGKCRGCGAMLQWFKTPHKKRIPITDPASFVPHWKDCPNSDKFRKG